MFLRNSIFEPLEDSLRKILNVRIVVIQKIWRGYIQRKRMWAFLVMSVSVHAPLLSVSGCVSSLLSYQAGYKRILKAVVRIQAVVRAAAMRFKYLRKRRAAIVIQAWTRGCVRCVC